MTSIADKIRTIRGTSGSMGLDAMATGLDVVQTDMTAAFSAVGDKGGTVPSSKVSGNLAAAINSIPAGMELNFEVVGGTTKPTNPKENTIWVNTDTEITGWHFSATQPENMAEGEVWFETGTASDIAFNALKENAIQVYPSSVIQRVSGKLKEVVAKTYKNGAWVEWTDFDKYIVYKGKTKKTTEVSSGVTRKDTDEAVCFVGNMGNNWAWFEDVDLTNWNTLKIEGAFSPNKYASLRVWPNNVTPNFDINSVAESKLSANGASLSVSALSGVHKVGVTWRYHSVDYPIQPTITNFYKE
jgi:hypothetical protein